MKLHCPACGAAVRADRFDVPNARANCGACGHYFTLPAPTVRASVVPLDSADVRESKQPSGAEVLVMRFPRVALLLIAPIFLGMVGLSTDQAVRAWSADGRVPGVVGLFVAIAVFLAWLMVAMLQMRHGIVLRDDSIEAWSTTFFAKRNARVAAGELRRIRLDTIRNSDGDENHRLVADRVSGEAVELFTGLDSADAYHYLAGRIALRYGLPVELAGGAASIVPAHES